MLACGLLVLNGAAHFGNTHNILPIAFIYTAVLVREQLCFCMISNAVFKPVILAFKKKLVAGVEHFPQNPGD